MFSLIDFKVMGDKTGNLIALQKGPNFPFDIKRVYYIWGTEKNVIRGKHAHHNLEQVIICTSGSCDFIVDNGKTKKTIHLSRPDQGLYLSGFVWREFTNFSPDCVIMVVASQPYDKSDYIHDYKEFLECCAKDINKSSCSINKKVNHD